jgi:predicted RNase H-like HicB family nuclease
VSTHDKFEAELWLSIRPAPGVPNQWVAHCLDLDIVTQGNSVEHAFEMLSEAVGMTVCDDLEAGRNPRRRKTAPQASWDEWDRVLKHGHRVPFKEFIHAKNITVVIPVHFVAKRKGLKIEKRPEAWMIDALTRRASPSRARA